MRQGYTQGNRLSFGPPLTPMVKILLMVNIGVYLLHFILESGGHLGTFNRLFGLMPSAVFGRLHVWQLVTYMFLQFDFRHILFNMFLLWMFGGELERRWGGKPFLQYYLITGVGAGLTYMAIMPLIDADSVNGVLIGASGAVYGVLTAYAVLYPDRKVFLLFIPIPIRVRWLVIGYICWDIIAMWSSDGVGHLAHLGGALCGFLYLKGGRRWVEQQIVSRRKRAAGKGFRVVDKDSDSGGGTWRPKKGNRVDEILEKISREGLDSLTAEEQDILRRASRH